MISYNELNVAGCILGCGQTAIQQEYQVIPGEAAGANQRICHTASFLRALATKITISGSE